MSIADQSKEQVPSVARDKTQARARRQPTKRCRLRYKKHTEVRYQTKPISEQKICTAYPLPKQMYPRKERSDFAAAEPIPNPQKK